ncbi:hypothetical protein QTP88_023243 [Uroleucon formosanum]
MIRVSTEESRCAVKFGNEKSEGFQTTTGLNQGDALSPIPFNIVLEMAVREVQEECKSELDIKRATELLIRSAKKRGLKQLKTKYMRIGRTKDRRLNAAGLYVGGYIMFEEVDDFKYLGTNLSNTNYNHKEIKNRMTSGNKCFYVFSGLLESKLLSKKSKELLYMLLARPVITYACKTWPMTKEHENRLAIMERKFLERFMDQKETKIKHTR